MSSAWEQSRRIPWSRLDQTPKSPDQQQVNPEDKRERILEQLQRERLIVEQEEANRIHDERHGKTGSEDDSNSNEYQQTTTKTLAKHPNSWTAIPFSSPELFRQVAFGVTMGSMTGIVFGFMDSMKLAGESPVLKRASNAAKGRFIFQGVTRSGLMFGGFFSGFHAVKYGIRVATDPGEYTETIAAGAISLGGMYVKPMTRASIPYAGMLVAMDMFHIYMRE
jgi:hypothetical protein